MPIACVDGRDLHYETRGSGDPLLLIQGLSGTHLSWGELFLGELERDFQLIAYDHRGIGFSAGDGGPFSIADLAADAVGLLDKLGIERAHVMGVSMGGMVAQELALGHSGRVLSLTLGCTYAGGEGSRLTDQAVIQRLMTASLSGDRELALRTGWEVNTSAAFAAEPANYQAFREMASQLPAPIPVLLQQMQATLVHDTSARLPSLDVPTLVVHGDEDQMLDLSNGRHIAGLIPGARVRILERTGHLFWWERPHDSAELARDHVARLTSPASRKPTLEPAA